MSKNKKVLNSFVAYCEANPELRFWQALRNWSGAPFIFWGKKLSSEAECMVDTYYFEGKDK